MKLNNTFFHRHGSARRALVIAFGAAGAVVSVQAQAGCGYGTMVAPPPSWHTAPLHASEEKIAERAAIGPLIVGTWKFTFTSDGTAFPGPIPAGAPVDFGTVQWHPDGSEIMVSGARAPSTGDVCMGVWEQTGRGFFKLKHLALAWASSDSPPPIGPVVPAVFLGPSNIVENVKVSRSGDSYEGTFSIDQYAADGTTLLEHIAGTVIGTRMTAD